MAAPIKPPDKPFDGYKWHWAVLMPTEGLNDPTVFLGVLRVWGEHEGESPGAVGVIGDLAKVKKETGTRINLARTPDRNLWRNSGQYWKALALIGDSPGAIALTKFGRQVADGEITKTEFAATVVKTLELPNRRIQADAADWDNAGLSIKPLQLILDVLAKLRDDYGTKESFMTREEVVKIIIPLAGAKRPLDDHSRAIHLFRSGKLDISQWPDCAPESNDGRMAKEFLLFLSHYGFLQKRLDENTEKFYLVGIDREEMDRFAALTIPTGEDPAVTVRKVQGTNFPAIAERRRVMRELTERPQQRIFRNNVLAKSHSVCLFTGVNLEEVLEASHIIPVRFKGNDRVENGICLRSDLHLLFDTGHLRIEPSGKVHLTPAARRKENYGLLQPAVTLPKWINSEYVEWRWKYYSY
ncbi:MAG: HNH endonuclease signature motif containing protein [Acidobacteriota bacterium]|nr:HNH endonuclease signature motif containing protein [Acidobacteriota bacterium]